MIALYDRDFIERPIDALYNLQLMKLSTYYKQQREMVSLITDLSRARYYSKIIYRQINPNLSFPMELYQYPNIEIGGYGVEGKYIALPEEIENCQPDVSLYESEWQKASKEILLTKTHEKIHRYQTRGSHIQLAYDDKKFTNPYVTLGERSPRIIIHDARIPYIEGAIDFFKDLQNQSGKITLMMRRQAIIEDYEMLYTIAGFDNYTEYNCLVYKGQITEPQFKALCKRAAKGFMRNLYFTYGFFEKYSYKVDEELITLTRRILYAKSVKYPHEVIYVQKMNEPVPNIIYSYLSQWGHQRRGSVVIEKQPSFKAFLTSRGFFYNKDNIEAYDIITTRIPQLKLLFTIDPQTIADNGGIMPL